MSREVVVGECCAPRDGVEGVWLRPPRGRESTLGAVTEAGRARLLEERSPELDTPCTQMLAFEPVGGRGGLATGSGVHLLRLFLWGTRMLAEGAGACVPLCWR